jgi:hypothetical protein
VVEEEADAGRGERDEVCVRECRSVPVGCGVGKAGQVVWWGSMPVVGGAFGSDRVSELERMKGRTIMRPRRGRFHRLNLFGRSNWLAI